ncbi:hypothetical protein ACL02T_30415 [Pseudonocardia sp. RS010]
MKIFSSSAMPSSCGNVSSPRPVKVSGEHSTMNVLTPALVG